MKKFLSLLLVLTVLIALNGCKKEEEKNDYTNVQSILNSTDAFDVSNQVDVDVTIVKVIHIKDQTAHDNEYSYYIVETQSHDWGYAEFRNGIVRSFDVGFSKANAKTRCKDLAEYRISEAGGLFE